MENSKYIRESQLLREKIINGDFGAPGSRFISTRELAKKLNISLVTAQKIMDKLKNEFLIELIGKKYYLTYGFIKNESEINTVKPKNKFIGIHVPNIETHYFSSLVRRIEKLIRDRGYFPIINSSNFEAEEEIRILNMMREINVAGIISCPGRGQEIKEVYESLPMPVVFLSSYVKGLNYGAVVVNDYEGGKIVARHLINQGYDSFMYIGIERISHRVDDRLNGFRDCLEENGKHFGDENIVLVKAHEHEKLSQYVGNIINKIDKSVGVFCYSDLFAIDTLKSCKKYKLDIPSRVGIVGFDNLPETQIITPKLTTVYYSIEHIVLNTVDLLLDKIANCIENSKKCYIDPILIVRESSIKDKNI